MRFGAVFFFFFFHVSRFSSFGCQAVLLYLLQVCALVFLILFYCIKCGVPFLPPALDIGGKVCFFFFLFLVWLLCTGLEREKGKEQD